MAKAFVVDTGVHASGCDSGTEGPTRLTTAATCCLRAHHSPFSGAARVTDSSVYHLASALIGRCVGRKTPRS
jgi:hypothetical protein